jgi:hypothetical protein
VIHGSPPPGASDGKVYAPPQCPSVDVLLNHFDEEFPMAKQRSKPLGGFNSPISDIRSFVGNVTMKLPSVEKSLDPFSLFDDLEQWRVKGKRSPEEGIPKFEFFWRSVRGKSRLIGDPNDGMRKLHQLFQTFIQKACVQSSALSRFHELASATAFVPGTSTIGNVFKHLSSRHFYVVDMKDAYSTLDTNLLTLIITAILRFDEYEWDLAEFTQQVEQGVPNGCLEDLRKDPLFKRLQRFISQFYTTPNGYGLVTGGPASPYLFNLFYEATLDVGLRRLVRNHRGLSFTRYADDLVFSHRDQPIFPSLRKEIRKMIASSGATVNHRKSRFLDRDKGVVFITGFGINSTGEVVFPQKKRTKLRGMLRTALQNRAWGLERVRVIQGHITHYREYLKVRGISYTMSDYWMVSLVERFEANFAT